MRTRGALGWSLGTALFACGGATSTGEGAQDGSALRTCTIPAGTYSETFTLGAGGIHCPGLPAQTITIAENEAITGNEVTTGNGSFGLFDAGSDCTNGADSSTCTFTTSCTTATNGSSSSTSISLTFNDDSATGQESTKSTDSAGNVLSSCNYDIAVTMR
jgi:hypothetical protein